MNNKPMRRVEVVCVVGECRNYFILSGDSNSYGMDTWKSFIVQSSSVKVP